VRRLTDANGTAIFRIMGWSTAVSSTPGAPYNSGRVYGDGVLLSSPSIAIYDLDGHGLGPSDLSSWLGDFFGGNNPARGDYDGTGSPLGPNDLSKWLTAFFRSGSIQMCMPEGTCP